MLNKNVDATKARNFADKKSYVRLDHSEVLYGLDWRRRKKQLWDRCAGHCEMFTMMKRSHAAFCYGNAEEPHHIIPRSKRRDDRLQNLAALSHACHRAIDERKIGGRK